jgi:hypothetical protein
MYHSKKQRKNLAVDEETFFLAVMLAYGPPDPEAKNFGVSFAPGHWHSGVSVYLREHPRGRIFTQCVTNFGEAKCRAGRWYYRYTQWWRKQYGDNPAMSV